MLVNHPIHHAFLLFLAVFLNIANENPEVVEQLLEILAQQPQAHPVRPESSWQ